VVGVLFPRGDLQTLLHQDQAHVSHVLRNKERRIKRRGASPDTAISRQRSKEESRPAVRPGRDAATPCNSHRDRLDCSNANRCVLHRGSCTTCIATSSGCKDPVIFEKAQPKPKQVKYPMSADCLFEHRPCRQVDSKCGQGSQMENILYCIGFLLRVKTVCWRERWLALAVFWGRSHSVAS